MDDLTDDIQVKLIQDYVKSTYDNIASDFSSTRYKKWPKVDEFLKSRSEGSLLLDVGCGNGKYLDNRSTYNIGCDLSVNLLRICKSKGFEVVLCDMTRLPFREDMFDSTICIAALHHVISQKRRLGCVRDIAQLLSPSGGQLLVQVWSFEQELDRDNPYIKHGTKSKTGNSQNFKLSASLELPVHINRTPFANQDVLVPFHPKTSTSSDGQPKSAQLRYYHVFKQGELESILEEIPNTKLVESYYDRGNWCAVMQRQEEIALPSGTRARCRANVKS